MQTFDASSVIYAWDNYPPKQFPPLWRWIAGQIKAGSISIPRVAFEEVKRHAPDCAQWLDKQDIERVAMSNEIVQEAFRIKQLLGIDGDRYSPKRVGENDLLIVATAKISDLELVSNEAKQRQRPDILANCKIPAVCEMPEVDVQCIDFITLIKQSGQVFEGPGL